VYEPAEDGFVAEKTTVTVCPGVILLEELEAVKDMVREDTDPDQDCPLDAFTLVNETIVYPVGIVMVPEPMSLLPVSVNVTVYDTWVKPASVNVGDMLAV
jgi:hypothetical protein